MPVLAHASACHICFDQVLTSISIRVVRLDYLIMVGREVQMVLFLEALRLLFAIERSRLRLVIVRPALHKILISQ